MHCKGKMVRATAPFQIDRKNYHITLDGIPAWICSQCGEAYFEEAEVDTIQEVIQAVDDRTKKLVAA